jgi:asparagine synthetase B (glutamine-hydrolysing)
MCGIVALFSRQRRISAEVLKRGTKSLYHRGPDGRRALKNRHSGVVSGDFGHRIPAVRSAARDLL